MFSERQTVDRYLSYIRQVNAREDECFLQDLQTQESAREVESRVLRNQAGDKQNRKLEEWKQRILKEHRTLFYIVHDEGGFDPFQSHHTIIQSIIIAHYNMKKTSIVSKFLNLPEIADAKNVVLLQVTATPYALVTGDSRFVFIDSLFKILFVLTLSGLKCPTDMTWPSIRLLRTSESKDLLRRPKGRKK